MVRIDVQHLSHQRCHVFTLLTSRFNIVTDLLRHSPPRHPPHTPPLGLPTHADIAQALI